MVILPFVSVTSVYWVTKKFKKKNWFVVSALIICGCIYFSAHLGFLNWADSVGSRTHPDFETLEVVALERLVGLIVTFIGLTVCFVRIYRKKKAIK
jgi:hypothetical protein